MMKERAQGIKTNGKKSFEIIQATSNEVITGRYCGEFYENRAIVQIR